MDKLTLYSRSAHIIEQVPSGTNSVVLPRSAEVASIIAIDANGRIVPFDYFPETSLYNLLSNRKTGDRAEAAVKQGDEIVQGEILTLDDNNVTLLLPDGLVRTFREYDQVTVRIRDNITRARISFAHTDTPLLLSYLLSDIRWICVGTALIHNDILHLRLTGNIHNNTERNYRAQVSLISGVVHQNRYSQQAESSPRMMMAASRAPMTDEQVPSGLAEDYTRYDVGEQIITEQSVVELGVWAFHTTKIYTHQTQERNIVRFGYRFNTTEFIPECSVNVYSVDSNQCIDSYLGTDQIKETQKGEDVDLILGQSTRVQCATVIESSEQLETTNNDTEERKTRILTENITITIKNYNLDSVTLIIKHFVGDRRLLSHTCDYQKREKGFLEWHFSIPGRSEIEPREETFSCEIVTASHY